MRRVDVTTSRHLEKRTQTRERKRFQQTIGNISLYICCLHLLPFKIDISKAKNWQNLNHVTQKFKKKNQILNWRKKEITKQTNKRFAKNFWTRCVCWAAAYFRFCPDPCPFFSPLWLQFVERKHKDKKKRQKKNLPPATIHHFFQFIACNSHQCWLANYTFFRAFVAQSLSLTTCI